jgi:Domain of unknown function (DUF4349)
MRIRKYTPPPPETTRELAALDAALAGDPVDPDLTDLEELALALRAERPVPRERFLAELDALVEAGFRPVEPESRATHDRVRTDADPAASGAAPRRRAWRFSLPSRRAVPLAMGTAASFLIGITAVLSSGVLSSDTGRDHAEPASPESAVLDQKAPARDREGLESGAPLSEPAPGAGGGTQVTPAPGGLTPPGISPGVRERKVTRQASLTLSAPRDRVEDVADEVIRITDRYRGFVLSSSVSGGSDGRQAATLDLRIPASRLQPAIGDLSRLAHVRSRTQNTLDVTAGYVSARSRLREATAERRGLLRQLAASDTPNETASIRARLRLTNRRIARARAALRDVATQVRYATVGVSVEPQRSKLDRSDGWTAGEGFDDALGILGTSVAVALVVLAVLVPIGLLAGLAWLAVRGLRQGRRERALRSPRD